MFFANFGHKNKKGLENCLQCVAQKRETGRKWGGSERDGQTDRQNEKE